MMNSEGLAEPVSASTGRIAPFGKYLLLQRVSVGGMAEIFKALPEGAARIDEIVAIKRILPNIAEDDEFIGMFIDEARIAGSLNHPNICRIYELGRVNNDHYIAMQFLWGRDLLKVMNRYKKAGRFVSPTFVAWVGENACSALHYAHTKRDERGEPLHIIHRDVSPQNIIVGYSGQVKLIDFGVARAASQSQRTQAGILKGKFGYMSPEMIRGMAIDHRSDVFAMGICLHELLTGSRLFYGETDFATLELVRDAKVLPPSRKAPNVPPELDAIVMKALAREAEDRYQSADEMRIALADFLASYAPQYGQSDVGLAMREAFHVEVQRERERLELFWGMLARGELVRGASVPSSPPERGDRSPVSTLDASILPPPPVQRLPESPESADEEELLDEQTHIFFSSSEMDEIRTLDGNQGAAGPSTLSDMIPPAPAHVEALRSLYPSGTYERVGTVPPPSPFDTAGARGTMPPPSPFDPRRERVSTVPSPFDPPHAHGGTPSPFDPPRAHRERPSGERLVGASEPTPERGSGKVARYSVYALLALTVAVATYAVPRFATAGTGALEVEAVGDTDALVRVDGIVRGNPPLVVEGLAPGIHQVELEASGFEPARADVRIEAGQARAVKLALERPRPQTTEVGAPAPVVAPQITPLAAVPGKASEAARERPAKARARHAEGALEADAKHAAGSDESGASRDGEEDPVDEASPTVEGAVNSETQTGESLNEELAAASEGELLISTVPWSHVFVDDEDTGRDTPVRSLRVPAGPHKIGLRTPDDVMHQVDVVVEPGKVVRIIRRF